MSFAEMIPGDCEKCGSEDIDVDRTNGLTITCRACGHVETMSAAPRMETFDEMMRGGKA